MKRCYFVPLVLVSSALAAAAVVAAFYGTENWRGARAWKQARADLAAQGESMNFVDFIPPLVPDDRNLAMARLFAEALDYRRDSRTGEQVIGPGAPWANSPLSRMPAERNQTPASAGHSGASLWWKAGSALPLEPWQDLYATLDAFPHPARPGTAAEDILFALTKYKPALEEFAREAQARPQARFPVDWPQTPVASIRLPQYALLMNLADTLRLRALAELAVGMHADAARETTEIFRICDLIRHDPFLIAHLVEDSLVGLALQPVWEGLANRQWTTEELESIQDALRREDLLAGCANALRSQRAFTCRMLDEFQVSRKFEDIYGSPVAGDPPRENPDLAAWASAVMPRGWVDQNKAMACHDLQRWILNAIDLKARRVKPGVVDEGERDALGVKFSWCTFFFKSQLPLYASALLKATRAQTACEEAEMACALERYDLARGAYPDTMGALVPDYLERVPSDLIDGKPLRYDKLRGGRYQIYGIGWDGVDDHGGIGWKRNTDPKTGTKGPWWMDDKSGDWSWRYTPVERPGDKR